MKDFAVKTINTTYFVTCVQIMVVDHVTVEWVASSSFQKCHFLENEFKLANQTPETKWRDFLTRKKVQMINILTWKDFSLKQRDWNFSDPWNIYKIMDHLAC